MAIKVTDWPGYSYGAFIDGVDLETMTEETWMEIAEVYLKKLVIVIRNVGYPELPAEKNQEWITKWGVIRSLDMFREMPKEIEEEYNDVLDRLNVKSSDGRHSHVLRVSGNRDAQGRPIGMFSDGELRWHANEGGSLNHGPSVSLLGREGMTKSCTGFNISAQWWEDQTEDFRSELWDVVTENKYQPFRINPENLDPGQAIIANRNQCVENDDIPLVAQSPGGIMGIHYPYATFAKFKNMTKKESDKLHSTITESLFTDKYTYDYWYQNDTDWCIFDNSISLHRRMGETKGRVCWRIQHTVDFIDGGNYNPYFIEPYKTMHAENTKYMKDRYDKASYALY